VNGPRVKSQWLPEVVEYGPGGFSPQAMRQVQAMGYALKEVSSWGSALAIVIDQTSGLRLGGTDRRHPEGLAAGF